MSAALQAAKYNLLGGSGGDGQLSPNAKRGLSCGGLCCCLCVVLPLSVWMFRTLTIGRAFHGDIDYIRPKKAVEAEAQRRKYADEWDRKEGKLLTLTDLPSAISVANSVGSALLFPYFNFVQGFPVPGIWESVRWFFEGLIWGHPKWKPPVKGEKIGVVSYQDFSKDHFGKSFSEDFFKDYYTGDRVPSWEDNERHQAGVRRLDAGVAAARAVGVEPVNVLRRMEPRVAFDNAALTKIGWDGFRYMGPLDTEYASNGVFGIAVVERLMEKYNTSSDVLGLLMTDSVFSAHLVRDRKDGKLYHVSLDVLKKYTPIEGYASLGGAASFREDGSRLRTVRLAFGGKVYTKFDVPEVDQDYERRSTRSGWRFAEGAFIASLLSMTNLVMHVKDLHLEIAAAFQAVTVDAFAGEPTHPVRRLLDPFISRSVQATNDNFKLLFAYHAADFSLAPLPHDEQLKLIAESIKDRPLNLADMDMENYGTKRHMDPRSSTKSAVNNGTRWGWRWHYRALTVQRLLDKHIQCWLDAHWDGDLDAALAKDGTLQSWWRSMIDHLPSLKRATRLSPHWASSGKLTAEALRRVARTLMVWLSWIHEDVGHSAAAYVYNPVYTPMCVPEDGVGVPFMSWNFNAVAYRGFVFLHRAGLMDEPPDFWFDDNAKSRQCFADFQGSLALLGKEDVAFSECDETGFYSCVERVETAVSS